MRYDLIIIGETELAHREAVRAVRKNQLVAVVRTVPLIDAIFHYPLETWNWSAHPTWKTMQDQFLSAESKLSATYASDGIELFDGQPVHIEEDRLTIRDGKEHLIELHADRFRVAECVENIIPDWLRMEVPHISELADITRLNMLPESVFIEGNSLAALRFAVFCARLNRNVIVCSAGWNAPEFGFELAELQDEAASRGILKLEQRELHSVCESSSGEFDIWLLNGDVHRAGLYVYGEERAREAVQQLAISD